MELFSIFMDVNPEPKKNYMVYTKLCEEQKKNDTAYILEFNVAYCRCW